MYIYIYILYKKYPKTNDIQQKNYRTYIYIYICRYYIYINIKKLHTTEKIEHTYMYILYIKNITKTNGIQQKNNRTYIYIYIL